MAARKLAAKKAPSKISKSGPVAATGRNPDQQGQRVTRVPRAGKSKSLGPGAKPAGADLAENRTPPKASAGSQAGPTMPGNANPVKNRPARSKPSSVSGTPNIRDNTSPGTTISTRANAAGRRRKAAG